MRAGRAAITTAESRAGISLYAAVPDRPRGDRRKRGWHLGVRNPQLPTQSPLGRSGVETSTMRLVTLVQDDRNVGEVVA